MDKMIIFSFTGEGTQLNRKLNQFCKRNEIPVESYSVERYAENEILPLPQKSQEFIRENWGKSGFIFIGAAGIAVRWIAPFVKDKFTDSPVLVMDEKGKYVIPILSGHIGGAVELAEQIGMWIEAEVVHTTATDVQQKFAGILEKTCDAEKLRNGECRANLQTLDGKLQIPVATKGSRALRKQHGECIACFLLGLLNRR